MDSTKYLIQKLFQGEKRQRGKTISNIWWLIHEKVKLSSGTIQNTRSKSWNKYLYMYTNGSKIPRVGQHTRV